MDKENQPKTRQNSQYKKKRQKQLNEIEDLKNSFEILRCPVENQYHFVSKMISEMVTEMVFEINSELMMFDPTMINISISIEWYLYYTKPSEKISSLFEENPREILSKLINNNLPKKYIHNTKWLHNLDLTKGTDQLLGKIVSVIFYYYDKQ